METFSYVAKELGKRNIAFIFTRDHLAEDSISFEMKKLFGGVFIVNEKYTKESAEVALIEGRADSVSFGIPFISNPDLPERFKINAKLNETNFETIYAEGELGYTDYPSL